MNHFVLHDASDTVAVVVVEGIQSGMELNGWIMDDNRHIKVTATKTSRSATRSRSRT